jgi:hypothetical protein
VYETFKTFKKMREELESEKDVGTQRWAHREKQLQAGVNQLLGIGGEIQGLAQNAPGRPRSTAYDSLLSQRHRTPHKYIMILDLCRAVQSVENA